MNDTSKPCPDQQTLLQFIQGRLEPPTLDQCEDHVSACQSCHETLRGLDANDTLSHYVSEALQQPSENPSDTQAIDGLMQRLLDPGVARPNIQQSASAEILADRAAEVLRCVEPAAVGNEESLGTIGNYRLLRLLGAGGTGVVFQAIDISLDRVVALKVLRPSLGDIARERFIAEARLAASIEHDNVVTIYQIGQEGRLAFIAMQWLPGETLETRLNRESGLLDEDTVREFVSQIASGLSAAHQRQLIHRDIKPANIWICDATGRLKILDFGLARIADEESSLTQTGMLAGTPSFMSPEQTRGMELDARSDLFSLGCVMYRLLTGRLPFSASTVLGTLQTIQSETPPPPITMNADCNEDLSDLTMSLLEKLPGNRLGTAKNLIACLNNKRSKWPHSIPTVSGKPLAAGPAKALAPATPRSLSSHIRWLVAASLAGILCITGWLMAPQIFRIVTDQGELVIKTEDPNIKVEVRENGDLVRVLDLSSNESFDIRSGNYSFSATKQGSNTKFEVTPKSVKMTRGAKELVSVTIYKAQQNQSDRFPEISEEPVSRIPLPADGKDRASILSMALMLQNKKLNRLRDQYRDSHPEVVHARVRLQEIADQYHATAQSNGSTPKVASNPFNKQIASTDSQFSLTPSTTETPIYGGRNFEQWFKIAKLDREPKTVADAIAACAVLADAEQKAPFMEFFRLLIRKHGSSQSSNALSNLSSVPASRDIYFSGFVKAVSSFEPEEIASLIQHEINSGNERSLGFCSQLLFLGNLNFDPDVQNRFYETLSLDIDPLLERISNDKLNPDLNVIAFLQGVLYRKNTTISYDKVMKAISSIPVGDRPSLYLSFLVHFGNSNFDEMIEEDFFADDTAGQTREFLLTALSINNFYGGGGLGGGGLAPSNPPESNLRLANRLLIKSMQLALDPDSKVPEFETLSDLWYDKEGILQVQTSVDGSGAKTFWRSSNGSFSEVRNADVRQIKGRLAIVRNLLSWLCQNVVANPEATENWEEVLKFAEEMNESGAFGELAKENGFQAIKIQQDVETLLSSLKGKENSTFSEFSEVPSNNRSAGGLF